MRSRLFGLYAITDPRLLPGESLFKGVLAAVKGGASVIQYRNKHASFAQQLKEVRTLVAITGEAGVPLLVNDNLELCMEANADGLHLGRSDGDIASARAILGNEKILGVTCHSDLQYAKDCSILGANYCAFGRIFPSRTKPDAPACSLSTLRRAASAEYSSVAIGGITHQNAQQTLSCGVDMIAAIHGVFGQADIEKAASTFSRLFIQE